MNKIDSVLELTTIFKLAHNLRKNGKTVGFTHGTYDLLHFGHIDFLLNSAKKCDFLIVSVESDENVKSFKDSNRPIVGEKERVGILNSLSCVGTAFINHLPCKMDSYISLYKEIKPDFISYGERFAAEEQIKYQAGKAQVTLLPILHERISGSTTSLIKTILRRYGTN